MNKIRKVIHRLFRILTGKKGIYGKIGKKNRFTGHIFIHEMTELGNYNYIGPYTMMLDAKMGNYCSIGPGVKIGQSNHDLNCISTYGKICNNRNGFKMIDKPSVIGNDVWIAANAVVLQGVTIGDGAVIGAGAVVNKDIPPYAVAAGVPAKVIKYRFNEENQKIIRNSRWWECDLKKAFLEIDRLEKEMK